MTFDDRSFWRPRDLALLLDVSPAHIYREIESGAIEHVKIGARTIRVPARAVAKLVGQEVPERKVLDPQQRLEAFEARTGHTPDGFSQAWKDDAIRDTAEATRDLIEALALRDMQVPA